MSWANTGSSTSNSELPDEEEKRPRENGGAPRVWEDWGRSRFSRTERRLFLVTEGPVESGDTSVLRRRIKGPAGLKGDLFRVVLKMRCFDK